MADDTVQRLGMDTATLTGADRVVHDWIANHFGAAPLTFCRQMRWRTAWEAEVPVAGEVRTVLVRGSRGDAYTGPMTMRQEAGVHDIMERHGVPAPRVYGVIDEPLAIVMEKLPGGINSELIADPAARAKVREEFIEALVKLHAIPPGEFAAIGLPVGATPRESAFTLYKLSIDIVRDKLKYPVGFVEFAARWLERNNPEGRERVGFVTGDAGQFMYDGDRLTGLIDFEVAYVGDPAAEFAGMRLRDTTEPLGDISALCDYYESLTGDRISKALIEYHSAGFAATNSMLMWPLMFDPTPDLDYLSYLQFTIATSRWGLSGMAEFAGIRPEDPPAPVESPTAFPVAAPHVRRWIGAIDAADGTARYQLDAAADMARYLDRVNRYGASVLAADLEDARRLTGEAVTTREQADRAVDAWVRRAGPEQDGALIRHFHRWLWRQNFLLKGCGHQSYLTETSLQYIAPRAADRD